MADARVEWDMAALKRAAGTDPQVRDELERTTDAIKARANSMGGAFRTGLYHRDHQSPAVGNTPAVYDGNVTMVNGGNIGIVYTANYAAQKDNLQNNTLLKAKG